MIQEVRRNTALLILAMCASIILQRNDVSAVRILHREVNGCMCSDFTWFQEQIPQTRSKEDNVGNSTVQGRADIKGTFMGGCRSRNEDGDEFCYVHQPNTCKDARASTVFDGMDTSALACDCKFNRFGQCAKVFRNSHLGQGHVKKEYDQITEQK